MFFPSIYNAFHFGIPMYVYMRIFNAVFGRFSQITAYPSFYILWNFHFLFLFEGRAYRTCRLAPLPFCYLPSPGFRFVSSTSPMTK